MLQRLKAQAGKINFNEIYTLALASFGIPYIFYIYLDLRAAIASFIITQIVFGVLRERY